MALENQPFFRAPEVPKMPEIIPVIEVEEEEENLPVLTLDELENESTMSKVENIPSWRRKFMK